MRVGASQDCPLLEKQPSTQHGLEQESASGRMMLADLPPSSRDPLTVSAAVLAATVPARVEPVKDIMSMSRWRRP